MRENKSKAFCDGGFASDSGEEIMGLRKNCEEYH